MKWLVPILLIVCACEKPDAAPIYRDEAVALETYYRPILDGLAHRIDKIRERGQALREPVPGADQTGGALKAAMQKLGELHALIDPGHDGKSALDKHVADTADDALPALVGETHDRLAAGVELVDDKLNAVEDWAAEAEAELKRPAGSRGSRATPPIESELAPADQADAP